MDTIAEQNARLEQLLQTGAWRGRKVRIPKGTKITGTFKERERYARRTYVVSAYDFDRGYEGDQHISPESKHYHPPRPAKVCWVGSGGYWCYANLTDVEVLDA